MEENKSSIGSWLRNALIKPQEEVTSVPQSPQPTSQIKRSTPSITVVTPIVEENDTELDETYINHLSEFMEKNNQPGPDYLEFARSLDEMISEMGDGVTEEKIFQMTYKVGYKQNLPVPKLLETANVYINLFNQHKKEFNTYLDNESQKTVGSKSDENTRLNSMNTESGKKITELQKQIDSLTISMNQNNTKIQENLTVIDAETKKLGIKKVKFEKAFGFVTQKINDDIEKIKNYLTNIV